MLSNVLMVIKVIMNKDKAWKLMALVSQFFNVLIFDGHECQTMSANAHMKQYDSRMWKVIRKIFNKVFFWQENHCLQSHISSKMRADEYINGKIS